MVRKKILVTGGAGFIGFHLAGRLIERGYSVCVLDNICDYYDVNLKRDRLKLLDGKTNFTMIKGDIADKKKCPMFSRTGILILLLTSLLNRASDTL